MQNNKLDENWNATAEMLLRLISNGPKMYEALRVTTYQLTKIRKNDDRQSIQAINQALNVLHFIEDGL